MTDNEIEVVAEELAKIGGISWNPGREQGPLMRLVTDRYRAQARIVIANLDQIRTGREFSVSQDLPSIASQESVGRGSSREVRPEATVIYRPPGDRPAYPCRIVEIQGDRAYLAPILRIRIGWVSTEKLDSSTIAMISSDD
jgi:hypothetical protein